MKNKKEEDFASYISGKRVALVGPASSLTGQKLGEVIDSYDIVARVKTFIRDDTEDFGTRCDILYTSEPFDRCDIINKGVKSIHGHQSYVFEKFKDPLQVYSENNVKWLVSSYPSEEWFSDRFVGKWNALGDKINWRFSRPDLYFKVKEEMSTVSPSRPNSGFCSFLDMLSFEPEELFVCGLDFYRSLYYENYQNGLATKDTVSLWTTAFDKEGHHPDRQYECFRQIIQSTNVNVTLDPWFSNVVSDRKYDKIYDMRGD